MSARIRSFPTQADEALNQVRPAAKAPSTPAGQVPASVTAAFIHLVTLLNEQTDGRAELDVLVRDRATGETAGIAPVSEDMAIAMLAGFSSAAAVRPAGPARPVLAAVPRQPSLRVVRGTRPVTDSAR